MKAYKQKKQGGGKPMARKKRFAPNDNNLAIAYYRFSSHSQNEASIDQQLFSCLAVALLFRTELASLCKAFPLEGKVLGCDVGWLAHVRNHSFLQ